MFGFSAKTFQKSEESLILEWKRLLNSGEYNHSFIRVLSGSYKKEDGPRRAIHLTGTLI